MRKKTIFVFNFYLTNNNFDNFDILSDFDIFGTVENILNLNLINDWEIGCIYHKINKKCIY